MKIDLIELFKRREICHPTQIRSLEFRNSCCSLYLSGFPWWLDTADLDDRAQIVFRFEGIEDANVSRGWFLPDPAHEDLEEFSVERMNEQIWNMGVSAQVFCSSPLPDKLAVTVALDEFLGSSGCPYGTHYFLNNSYGNSIRGFEEVTSSSNYQICSGPKAVCDEVTKELARQNVQYSVVEQQTEDDHRLFVKWHGGFMICQSAIAEYE